jgi:hypothetical protein
MGLQRRETEAGQIMNSWKRKNLLVLVDRDSYDLNMVYRQFSSDWVREIFRSSL